MPKESENILKNYLIVDQWSSGRYHDQNYINMTKMNVPWIFFKKTQKYFEELSSITVSAVIVMKLEEKEAKIYTP